jgi:hypothetical protein
MAKIDVSSDRPTFASEYVKADMERAVFLGSPTLDNMFTALITLSSELWATRRRLKVIESQLEKKVGISREQTEQYLPTAEEEAQWIAERDEFVRYCFAQFLRDADIPYASTMSPFERPKG